MSIFLTENTLSFSVMPLLHDFGKLSLSWDWDASAWWLSCLHVGSWLCPHLVSVLGFVADFCFCGTNRSKSSCLSSWKLDVIVPRDWGKLPRSSVLWFLHFFLKKGKQLFSESRYIFVTDGNTLRNSSELHGSHQ